MERLVPTDFLSTDFVILNLHRGDFSTANNIANAVNEMFGEGSAIALDTNSVRVRAPQDPTQKVSFVSIWKLGSREVNPQQKSLLTQELELWL